MKNIIIMGPPGSGKDTQISEIKKHINMTMIAGGDVARMLAEKNPKLKALVDKGNLINDDLVLNEVDRIISTLPSETGIIFDGFPRDLYQAEKLSQILISHNRTLDAVIYLAVEEEEVVRRLSERKICSLCGVNIPVGAEKCSKCGGRPVRRVDDDPATVINRMQTFLDKTIPLITYYKNKGILIEVNGERPINVIAAEIKERLGLCQRVN